MSIAPNKIIDSIFRKLISLLLIVALLSINFYNAVPLFAASAQIRQEINILGGYLGAPANTVATSSEIINIDTTKYSGTPTFYFEIVASTSAAFSNTVTLRRSGGSTDDCTITIPNPTTSYTLLRSSSCTLPAGSTDYVVRISSNASGTTGVLSARVVILQSFADSATDATATQTQIEIGNKETGKTNTTNSALSAPKYWKYDSTKWDGTLTAYAEVSYKNTQTSSSTVYATAGTFTYVPVRGESYTIVELWGAGGAGGVVANSGGAGGGGGAYARSTTTQDGVNDTIVVGAGPAADSTARNDSMWNTTEVVADGGAGSGTASVAASSGGTTAGSTGQVEYAGGNGAAGNGTGDSGGGGGSAGGPGANGNVGTAASTSAGGAGGSCNAANGGATGGTADTNDATAPDGGNGNANENCGSGGGGGDNGDFGGRGGSPGGGGGGGEITGGQVGGTGQARIKAIHGAVGIAIEEDDGTFNNWTFKQQIVNLGISTTSPSRIRSASFTPTDGRHYRIVASSTSNSTATYDIYNAKIIIDQTSASSFTKLEPQYLIANTSLSSGTSLQSFATKWDSTEWSGVTNTYIHDVNAVDNSTSVVGVYTSGDVLVTGSTVTSPDNRGVSSSMTMPSNTDLKVKATTNNGNIYSSRILAQVSIDQELIDISGTLYSDEGVSPYTTGGQVVTLRVGTSTPGIFSTTTLSGSGFWRFSNLLAPATSNVPISVWADNNTNLRAFTFTQASSTVNDIPNVDLYQNRLIVKHEATSGESVTNAELGVYDGDDDSDIQFTSNSNALAVNSGQELYIWPSKTYAPGGTIVLHGNAGSTPDGDLDIRSGAILTAGGNIIISGNLNVESSSTFNLNGFTTTFVATTTGKTISVSSTTHMFDNVSFNGSGGGWTFSNNATTTNFTIVAGTIVAPPNLEVRGDYSNSAIFTNSSGVLTFSSTSAQTISGTLTGTSALSNVIFRGSGAKSFSSSASTTNFTIESGSGAVTAPSAELSVSGNYLNSSIFTNNLGTTTFNGSSAQTISGTLTGTSAFGDVSFSGGGSKTFNSNASTTNFFIGSGTTVTAPSLLSIAGNYSNIGVFSNNLGTTTFDGSTDQYVAGILVGTSAFSNLEFNGGASGWYNSSWDYRVQITVDNTKVDAELTNFPVYLSLANMPSTFWDNTISGCGDLRITLADGTTEVPREIVWCDSGTDTGEVYFKASTLANSSDTSFYVYYGNAGASDYATNATYGGQKVWDQYYLTVQHFQETSGAYLDSTANNYQGTTFTLTSRTATGKMGYAPSFNGTTDIIYFDPLSGGIPIPQILGNMTQEAWVVQDTTGTRPIIQHGESGELEDINVNYGLEIEAGNLWQQWEYGAGLNEVLTTSATVGTGSFKMVGASRDVSANTVAWYLDGTSPVADSSYTNDPTGGENAILTIGARSSSAQWFDGVVDEVRISTTTRSSGWMSTQYNNQNSPGTFYSVSAVETPGRTLTFGSSASTTNFINKEGSTVVAPSSFLSISGNYVNSGVFTHNSGTTTFNGAVTQSISGIATGTSAFYNLEILNNYGTDPQTDPSVIFNSIASTTNNFYAVIPNSKIQFLAGLTSTSSIQNLILNGQDSSTRVSLRSTAAGTPFGLVVSGTRSISYANVADSNACSGLSYIDASNGTNLDSTGNSCWNFGEISSLSINSISNKVFEINQAYGDGALVTITDGTTPVITDSNDLRISIATSTINMRWLSSVTSLTFGGTASGKVANPVSYEGSNSVLVIPVSSSFAANDTLTISGLTFTDLNTATSSTIALGILKDGPSDITNDAVDSATVAIKGKYVLQDHADGQVSNKLDVESGALVESNIFQFRLVPTGESISVTSLDFTLADVLGIDQGDFSNLALFIDYDQDGVVDVGDLQVGGAGSVTLSGGAGTITFGTPFTATTSRSFILRTDIANISTSDEFIVGIYNSQFTSSGITSLQVITPNGVIQVKTHKNIGRKGGGGSGGSSSEEAPPEGQGVQVGGDEGGGSGGSEEPPPEGGGDNGGGNNGGGGGGEAYNNHQRKELVASAWFIVKNFFVSFL